MKIKHMTLICMLIAAMMLFAAPSYAAYDPSLVGYWKLDETSGGTAYDSTTNDNDGTINGDPTLGVTGQYGTAYDFDGDGDYIRVEDDDDWHFGTNDFTIAMWVYRNSDDYHILWHTSQVVNPAQNELFLRIQQGGHPRMLYEWNDVVIIDEISSHVTKVTLNNWHHVAYTRENDNFSFYIDGTEVHSFISDADLANFNDILSLAMRENAASTYTNKYPLDGTMDEVAVWHKGLNAEQVANLYSWGVEGFEASGQIPEPASMLFALAGLGFAWRRKTGSPLARE